MRQYYSVSVSRLGCPPVRFCVSLRSQARQLTRGGLEWCGLGDERRRGSAWAEARACGDPSFQRRG
eukprot:1896028-Rhodomonas_salina.1